VPNGEGMSAHLFQLSRFIYLAVQRRLDLLHESYEITVTNE
jgi:hypothetical protein